MWLKQIKLNESTISMIFGALVVIVVGALIVNYFRGVGRPKEELLTPEEIRLLEKEGRTTFGSLTLTTDKYTVLEGDHLWGIAVRAYGDGYRWAEIAKVNQLANPNSIRPGMVLTLPR